MSSSSTDCPYHYCNQEGIKKSSDGKYVYNPNCDGGKIMHIKARSKGTGRTTIICHGPDDPVYKTHLPLILGRSV